ncbi:helix-turn-helix domain-containing protein [Paenibacillus sp. FSL W8-0187]|uniref:AraC family transcriptional regulator n=1 Tax=unclassified Paenibacillus TaxID=185978 RepID=UPI0030DA52CC
MKANPFQIPYRSLTYHLVDADSRTESIGWTSGSLTSNSHTLLIFAKGKGSLHIDQHVLTITPGKCYLLCPGTTYQVHNGTDNAIQYSTLAFAVIQVGEQQHTTYKDELIPGKFELCAYPSSHLLRLIESLHSNGEYSSNIHWVQQHAKFHELLVFLLQQNIQADREPTSVQAVESVIQYVDEHYMYPDLTVKQLAEMAELSTWRFTHIFQERTGKKPLHYLTDLRINRAKELLAQRNEPLRNIAQEIGYTDEYYFSRRFRQITGMSPKQFAERMDVSKRVNDWTGHEVDIPSVPNRILYYGETFGDLLAIGMRPMAGNCLTNTHNQQADIQYALDISHRKNSIETMEWKPDLIILAHADEKEYRWFSKIAPTVTFNSFAPLAHRLHTLGDWLGRAHEADQWLNWYRTRTDNMWRELQQAMKPSETASVFVYDHGSRLFVMGMSGLSTGLYHARGFQPPEPIRKVLNDGLGYKEISTEELPFFAGDRIFMLIPGNAVSRQAAEDMMQSSLWDNLPAVRNGLVHVLGAERWNYGDARTLVKLLNLLPELLLSTSTSKNRLIVSQ